ncbi:unknown [Prevotella sp. CAG:474]|nr:unknown [Prevotella sp. CAG:474]
MTIIFLINSNSEFYRIINSRPNIWPITIFLI